MFRSGLWTMLRRVPVAVGETLDVSGGPSALPLGTVTLLLGDIEGSTRAWEERPEETKRALAELNELVDAAVAGHGGARPVEQGEGDSFVAAFSTASDALVCAIEIQRGLA